MRFIADRKAMLVICRNLARILPSSSPIADLTGILMEADEDTGILRLTANNMEIAIQYEVTAAVKSGGRMVVNSRLVSDMMPLLAGEKVSFNVINSGTVHIQSESAGYTVSCLPGTHYPKPEVPAPENTVQISGVATLAKQTAFAAKKPGQDAGIYSNIRLEVSPADIRMIATDTLRLAIARHKQEEVTGSMTLLIPSASLSVLASIAGDENVQAGVSKNSLVFTGSDFVFTSRTMSGEFMNVNEILKTIQPQYDALVPSRDLWRVVDSLDTVADGTAPLHLVLREEGVGLSYQGETSAFHAVADAMVYRPTPDAGFYYGVSSFIQALRYMEGNIRLMIDKSGMILLKSEDQCYLLSPVRPRKKAAKAEKKTKATKTKTAKAA